MMVNKWISNGAEEDAAFYSSVTDNNIDDTQDDNMTEKEDQEDFGFDKNPLHHQDKLKNLIWDGRSCTI